jgi:hypothetical protein
MAPVYVVIAVMGIPHRSTFNQLVHHKLGIFTLVASLSLLCFVVMYRAPMNEAPEAEAHRRPEAEVHRRLETLAGKEALDCGRATVETEYASKSACASGAFKSKTPFLVQYSVVGTDAHVEEGLAFDSHGTLSHVWTISSSPLYRGNQSGQFSTDVCNPQSLRKLGNDELTCDFTQTIGDD